MRQSTSKKDPRTSSHRARKAVNSWIIFRAYYCRGIKDLPQRSRSPILAMMWKQDTDHDLWELLSTTFTYIRDRHAEDCVSLDKFLDVMVDAVPVTPSDIYFERHGRRRIDDRFQKVKAVHTGPPNSSAVSCAELVNLCHRQGIISRAPTWFDMKSATQELGQMPGLTTSFACKTLPFSAHNVQSNSPTNSYCAKYDTMATVKRELVPDSTGSETTQAREKGAASLRCLSLSPIQPSFGPEDNENTFEYPFFDSSPLFPHVGISLLFESDNEILRALHD